MSLVRCQRQLSKHIGSKKGEGYVHKSRCPKFILLTLPLKYNRAIGEPCSKSDKCQFFAPFEFAL